MKKIVIACTLTVLILCCLFAYKSVIGKPSEGIGTITAEEDGLRLISVRTPVRLGELCSITIEGQPDTAYSAKCTYRLGNFPETINQTKVSGHNGRVTWAWFVKEITTPGSYEVTITGGGRTLKTSYTVIK